MRRLFPTLAFSLLLALSSVGGAQDVGADVDGEDAATEGGPGYEPDQRGGHEEDGQGGDTSGGGEGTDTTSDGDEPQYEPDQRGGHEGDEEEASEPVSEMLAADSSAGGRGYADRDGGLGFYTHFLLGGGLTGLDAIEGDNLVLPAQQGSFDVSFGLALGLRIGPISIGPRLTFTADPSFFLGALGLDVGADLTDDRLAPTLRVSLSYAFALSLSDPLPSQRSVGGLWAEVGAGFRYTVEGPLYFGAELSGGWLALFRAADPACVDMCTDMGTFDLRRSGESHGLTLRLHLYGGFGF